MNNKTTLELIEKLECFRVGGIRGYCHALGFLHVKAALKTRGIVVDDDVFFSRPKKNVTSVEIKSYQELFNIDYLKCLN